MRSTMTDDRVGLHVVVGDVGRRVVGKDGQALALPGDVRRGIVYKQVDVLGEPVTAVGDDREAADEHVACPGLVQRAGDAGEVVRLRRAGVCRII
jgi:hypothetical protein